MYLLTRRCTQRQFLLRPSEQTNQNITYCLALAARNTGVILHGVCFMSNHWHGVLTDPDARLPEFLERFHRLLAKTQNALLGRRENFWSSEKTSVVLLASHGAVLEKLAYTLANPVSGGLVDSPSDWPGVILSFHKTASLAVTRPKVFFDTAGSQPKQAELNFARPKIYTELDDAQFARLLEQATSRFVENARAEAAKRGQQALGAAAVLNQDPASGPSTPSSSRGINPRIASKSTKRRVEAIDGMLRFLRAYREAFTQWRSGVRDVLFPAGTYALRVHSGVTCVPD